MPSTTDAYAYVDPAQIWDLIGRNPNVLLTRPQAAVALNVSERWLELGAHQGYGPPVIRLGHRTKRYRGKAIADYAASVEAGGISDG
ncbi:MAG: hypothetical protein AAFR79_15055 [Pseudomonadota bacterium]